MTESPNAAGWPPVLCPYCLDPVRFNAEELYLRDSKNQHQKADITKTTNRFLLDEAMRRAFVRCPGMLENYRQHYVPVPYLTHGQPLTVAMVGDWSTGKTHLLAAMIAEIERGGLDPYGLKWRSVNADVHARFRERRLVPLQKGEMLEATRETDFVDFEDALLITGSGFTRPVAFFDIAGEVLARTGRATRFLAGVNAFIFVVDPLRTLPLPHLDALRQQLGWQVSSLGDPSFGTVLDRIPRSGPYLDVVAALVVNKSDLVRFEPPVDRWLMEERRDAFSPRLVHDESRDVYAFVRHHGGDAWLRPVKDCRACTLHFASATGGQSQNTVFPQGVRPRRVLEPLLAIFAMSGLLDGADLDGVGA
jgi:hypothetical protein